MSQQRYTAHMYSSAQLALFCTGAGSPRMSHQRVSVIVPDFLFLSDMTAALDESVVFGDQGYNFTHIINATDGCAPNKFAGTGSIQYLNINIEDDATAEDQMLAAFGLAYDWVSARDLKEMRLLVHCMCGVSRSASIVVALLAKLQTGVPEGSSVWHCFQFVKERRPIIRPNAGFLRALLAWQDLLGPGATLHDEERQQLLSLIAQMELSDTRAPPAGKVRGALDRLAEDQAVFPWCSIL